MTEDALLELVSRTFRSLWPMELLVMLCEQPRRAWPIDALARALRANVPVVTESLATLEAIGLVAAGPDQTYRFEARTGELADVARELIDLYNRRPRAVMRAIFAAPRDRIQTFADAFRLRKDTC